MTTLSDQVATSLRAAIFDTTSWLSLSGTLWLTSEDPDNDDGTTITSPFTRRSDVATVGEFMESHDRTADLLVDKAAVPTLTYGAGGYWGTVDIDGVRWKISGIQSETQYMFKVSLVRQVEQAAGQTRGRPGQ